MTLILNMVMAKGQRKSSKNQKMYGLTISTRLNEQLVNDIRISATKLGITVSKYIAMLVQKGEYETEMIDNLNQEIEKINEKVYAVKKTRLEAVGMLIKKMAKNDKEVNKYIDYYNKTIGEIEERKRAMRGIIE